MKHSLFFWVPIGLGMVLFGGSIVMLSCFIPPIYAVLIGLTLMTALALFHYYWLYQLDCWFVGERKTPIPSGWGTWQDVCYHFDELNQQEHRIRQDMRKWLDCFRHAMGFLPDGVVIMDENFLLDWCNPMAEKHLNIHAKKDVGLRMTRLVKHTEFIDYLIMGQFAHPIEMTYNERVLLLKVIPFDNHRRLLVTHDRTDTIRIDKMRRDFIANASHELRTPLTVINGFLEIAESQPDLDKQTRLAHLTMMREQGERMQVLVQDMLTLTNLESSDNPVNREIFNARELINRLYRDAIVLSSDKNTITLENNGPETLYACQEEIRIAFSNLITNAVRYTPDGGHIVIRWTNNEKGPCFSVEDDGIGIEAKHIPRLTQRFYRVDKSHSRKINGTGLGLSIVRHVLIRHSGELNIQSEPGKGSTFSILFSKSILKPESFL